MKYKVGDKVKISETLPLYMRKHFVSALAPDELKYNGMIVTVTEVKENLYKIEEDKGFYDWYEYMLEPVEEMSAEEAIKLSGNLCSKIECCHCPVRKLRIKYGTMCFEIRAKHAAEFLEVLKKWKADHEKKPIETEFVNVVRVIEDAGDTKRCVYEEEIRYDEDREEAQVRVLKEYCEKHDGKFFAVMENICRVKE